MNKTPFSPHVTTALLCCGCLLSTLSMAQGHRYVDPSHDLANLPTGAGASVLTDSGDQQIIRMRNWAALYATRIIEANDYTLALPERLENFSDFRYEVEGQSYSLDEYLIRNENAGLLIIKDGKIKLEHYGMGNTEETLWASFSMSKSVTSLLLGAAIKDGYIASVDDKVTDYLPRLKGSSYDDVSIRNVLQMSSGVAWNEDYTDLNSDVASYPSMDLVKMYEFLGTKERVAEPGEVFNYNTGETDLVGAIVRAAIGNNLATYLEYKIWQPFGMEFDANWATHGNAGERAGCCMNVTLRDYGRLGLFAMNDGTLPDGTSILPDNWMSESTTASKGSVGYGYLWWLAANGSFNARGIFGQAIHINPTENLIVVVLSAWSHAAAGGTVSEAHRVALYKALADFL
jgi:CubicO group peptidase (beta-lactamase class C family)